MRFSPWTLAQRFIVAGGGGGTSSYDGLQAPGGAGGGLLHTGSGWLNPPPIGGTGGGNGTVGNTYYGGNGTLGQGGAGSGPCGGGGGGGGYYGGGGGANTWVGYEIAYCGTFGGIGLGAPGAGNGTMRFNSPYRSESAGGGSGFINLTLALNLASAAGNNTGNGWGAHHLLILPPPSFSLSPLLLFSTSALSSPELGGALSLPPTTLPRRPVPLLLRSCASLAGSCAWLLACACGVSLPVCSWCVFVGWLHVRRLACVSFSSPSPSRVTASVPVYVCVPCECLVRSHAPRVCVRLSLSLSMSVCVCNSLSLSLSLCVFLRVYLVCVWMALGSVAVRGDWLSLPCLPPSSFLLPPYLP